jgi:hypothetical protein
VEFIDGRWVHRTGTTLPGPKQAKALTLRCDHSLWFDYDQRTSPSGPDTREPNPKHFVPGPKSWPAGNRTPQDVDLVAQSNDLNLELPPSSQTENDGRKQRNQDAIHESRGYQFDRVRAIFSIWTEFSAARPNTAARILLGKTKNLPLEIGIISKEIGNQIGHRFRNDWKMGERQAQTLPELLEAGL